jgi:hypothetical protein
MMQGAQDSRVIRLRQSTEEKAGNDDAAGQSEAPRQGLQRAYQSRGRTGVGQTNVGETQAVDP